MALPLEYNELPLMQAVVVKILTGYLPRSVLASMSVLIPLRRLYMLGTYFH